MPIQPGVNAREGVENFPNVLGNYAKTSRASAASREIWA
jgi:hypothetical protein